ncbi:MAG: MBOAT family protein [Anaerolineae bacterium]|nr:MBOAT family protein [Anaerolineae bacterium]
MTLTHIVVFVVLALLCGALVRGRGRGWLLMGASVVAVYWLQPALRIPYLDFAFPAITLALAVVVWAVTRAGDQPVTREDGAALGVTAALVLALAATRCLDLDTAAWWSPTAARPPDLPSVALALAALGIGAVLPALLGGRRPWVRGAMVIFIIALFAVMKTGPLAQTAAGAVRQLAGRDPALASATDLGWLGFSYVAFRLLHTLRDRITGKLPALSLREYLTYVIFFPAVTAGPIDRAERFVRDVRALPDLPGLEASRMVQGGARIVIGVFKKFVIADSLALAALNPAIAAQTGSTLWTWALLYGYAFQLFFDFSGYTDIAIGIGMLFGVKLPENFDRPYLKTNITAFWQNWHKTLSDWVRFYVFMPISRNLMMRERKPPLLLIVLAAQMATMIVIGLWHGVTVNFVIWGVWHGAGLFVHKVWTDRTRKWYRGLDEKPWLKRAWAAAGVLLTFHFVTLSWVWFALPDFDSALDVFLRLFGV